MGGNSEISSVRLAGFELNSHIFITSDLLLASIFR